MREAQVLPPELNHYTGRQRAMLEVIYERGGATAKEIYTELSDPPPCIHGLRTLLNRLISKGIITKRRSGRHSELVYVPRIADTSLKERAFQAIARQYFEGSTESALQALNSLAEEEQGEGLQ